MTGSPSKPKAPPKPSALPTPVIMDEAISGTTKAKKKGRSSQILAGQINSQLLNFGKTRVGE